MVLLASNAFSNVNKIQIYGDKFFFQNIYLAGSKGFWGTLNCLKSQKIPNQKKHLLGNNWCQTWFHSHFKWHFQLYKIQKILAGARFPHKNNIYGITGGKIFKDVS